jgi:hypothetical protein
MTLLFRWECPVAAGAEGYPSRSLDLANLNDPRTFGAIIPFGW